MAAGMARDSTCSSMIHGRFVATQRPSTTGPATPRHAASMGWRGPDSRNRPMAASSESYWRLCNDVSRTGINPDPRFS